MKRGFQPLWVGSVLLVMAGGCATQRLDSGATPRTFDAGPLASRFVEADGTVRERALGPLVERTRSPESSVTALRPLYAKTTDAESGWTRHEGLWPLAVVRTLDAHETAARIGFIYYRHAARGDDPNAWRLWVFPLYFQGRNARGQRHAALFPLGGRIRAFLGQDEIDFFLFPLWLQTRVNEVETTAVAWPFLSRTDGPGIRRRRVFPLYGVNRHQDRYTKRFVLWPVWTQVRYTYPQTEGRAFLLFPVYGQVRRVDQRSDLFLPPFIRIDRSERLRAVTAPWPFLRVRSGEIDEITVWPLYQTRHNPPLQSGYFLWPIFRHFHVDRGTTSIRRRSALPFVQTETRTTTGETESAVEDSEVTGRRIRLWPLADYRRQEDRSRLRILALWPTAAEAVDRNWAPLWTLAERQTDGASRDTEILWGLFRRRERSEGVRYTSIFPLIEWEQSEDGTRRWSLLKGLIGSRRGPTSRSMRLLYGFTWERTEEPTP